MEATVYKVDAANRPVGRVATEVASLLIGKNSTEFARNIAPNVRVEIANVDKLKISEKKREQKEYQTYSRYPGGQKRIKMQDLIDKKGYEEVLRNAIYGMLPTNRLRAVRMKNIDFVK